MVFVRPSNLINCTPYTDFFFAGGVPNMASVLNTFSVLPSSLCQLDSVFLGFGDKNLNNREADVVFLFK